MAKYLNRWSSDEETRLASEYKKQMDIPAIAVLHERTPKSIVLRLLKLNLIDESHALIKKYKIDSSIQRSSDKGTNRSDRSEILELKALILELKKDIADIKEVLQEYLER